MDEGQDIGSGVPVRLAAAADIPPPVMDLDADGLEQYRPHIAHLSLPPARETEILVAVWRMMGSFVDRAFGDDPVQHVDDLRKREERHRASVLGSGEAHPQPESMSLSDAFAERGMGAGEESHER